MFTDHYCQYTVSRKHGFTQGMEYFEIAADFSVHRGLCDVCWREDCEVPERQGSEDTRRIHELYRGADRHSCLFHVKRQDF